MEATRQSFGGKWTAEKLERVGKYLAAYVQILKSRTWCEAFCYIDAFAGTGYNTQKAAGESDDGNVDFLPDVAAADNQEFLDGSARIALRITPPFSQYIFIKKSAERVKELEKLREEFPNLADRITAVEGDANEQIQHLCRTWNWKKRRAVLFLDPFGMQVEWPTIESIAKTEAIDMWLLFPAGIGVNRMLPRHGQISDAWRARLTAMFGVPDSAWYPQFFTQGPPDLFGEISPAKIATISSIARFWNDRLKTVFDCVAPNPLPLCNDSGTILYHLCFAAKNHTALKIAAYLLKPATAGS